MPEYEKYDVVIAEDDEDDYFFLEEVLLKQYPRLAIRWAKDGVELLEYLKDEEPPPLLLLDLNMPRKDGREALREIKKDPKLTDLPVIVFTTSNAEADKVFVQSFKNTLFVTKPIGYSNYLKFGESLKNNFAGYK